MASNTKTFDEARKLLTRIINEQDEAFHKMKTNNFDEDKNVKDDNDEVCKEIADEKDTLLLKFIRNKLDENNTRLNEKMKEVYKNIENLNQSLIHWEKIKLEILNNPKCDLDALAKLAKRKVSASCSLLEYIEKFDHFKTNMAFDDILRRLFTNGLTEEMKRKILMDRVKSYEGAKELAKNIYKFQTSSNCLFNENKLSDNKRDCCNDDDTQETKRCKYICSFCQNYGHTIEFCLSYKDQNKNKKTQKPIQYKSVEEQNKEICKQSIAKKFEFKKVQGKDLSHKFKNNSRINDQRFLTLPSVTTQISNHINNEVNVKFQLF